MNKILKSNHGLESWTRVLDVPQKALVLNNLMTFCFEETPPFGMSQQEFSEIDVLNNVASYLSMSCSHDIRSYKVGSDDVIASDTEGYYRWKIQIRDGTEKIVLEQEGHHDIDEEAGIIELLINLILSDYIVSAPFSVPFRALDASRTFDGTRSVSGFTRIDLAGLHRPLNHPTFFSSGAVLAFGDWWLGSPVLWVASKEEAAWKEIERNLMADGLLPK
jgi:hypothetical protein